MRVRVGASLASLGLLVVMGCGWGRNEPTPAFPFEGVELTLGKVGDPGAGPSDAAKPDAQELANPLLTNVAAQSGEWAATRKASVTTDATGAADLFVFTADRLGDLMDRNALATLPDEAVRPPDSTIEEADAPEGTPPDVLEFGDILPAFRDDVIRYGDELRALPLGGSALVLVYRRDAFENQANTRAATDAGLTLEPPKTWERLDALARFFQGRDWDGDGQEDAGIALALAPDEEGLGTATFLARAGAIGLHPDHFAFLFDDETMDPLIVSAPFVESLSALVALAKECGPEGDSPLDAAAAREAFRAGRVALLIDRAERASEWTSTKRPLSVGVAALPGSEKVFDPDRQDWQEVSSLNRPSILPHGGGWLVGVSSEVEGTTRDAAFDFLRYLAGPETSRRVQGDRLFPMLAVRSAQIGAGLPDPRSAPGVDPMLWARAVGETLTASRVVPSLRIPEAPGYLADLGKAVGAVAQGTPAESALTDAAAAWTERTKRLGTERQLWHYRRSLNRPVASTEPPPR